MITMFGEINPGFFRRHSAHPQVSGPWRRRYFVNQPFGF
jgi:hypothetical protein